MNLNQKYDSTFYAFLILFGLIIIGVLFGNFLFFNDSNAISKWYCLYGGMALSGILAAVKTGQQKTVVSKREVLLVCMVSGYIFIHVLVFIRFKTDFFINSLAFFVLFLVFIQFISINNIRFYFIAIAFICGLLALYGIGQNFLLFFSRSQFKVSGNFDNPAGYAVSLVLGVPFCLYFIKSEIKSIKYSAVFLFFLMIIAIIMSGSRAGIIAVLAVTSWYVLQQYGNRIANIKVWKKIIISFVSIVIFTGLSLQRKILPMGECLYGAVRGI